MIGLTRGPAGGPRWNPAIDLGAVAAGRESRIRAADPAALDSHIAESDLRHDGEDDPGRGQERRRTPQPPVSGGAPDPSGNTGRTLDAFA